MKVTNPVKENEVKLFKIIYVGYEKFMACRSRLPGLLIDVIVNSSHCSPTLKCSIIP